MKKKQRKTLKELKWRDLIDKIHVYGGLFISGYLIIVGLSSLQYQHHFNLPENGSEKHWEQKIDMPEIGNKLAYKLAIRDSLGLFGHAPWWQDYKDKKGVHHFMITRPGKSYWIEVPVENNIYKITEKRSSFLSVAMALHGLTGGGDNVMNAPGFIFIWKIIAQVMNVIFLLVLFITVYFWIARSIRKKAGWIFVGTFAVTSLTILLFIWLIG